MSCTRVCTCEASHQSSQSHTHTCTHWYELLYASCTGVRAPVRLLLALSSARSYDSCMRGPVCVCVCVCVCVSYLARSGQLCAVCVPGHPLDSVAMALHASHEYIHTHVSHTRTNDHTSC